jgi:hypothetical protein
VSLKRSDEAIQLAKLAGAPRLFPRARDDKQECDGCRLTMPSLFNQETEIAHGTRRTRIGEMKHALPTEHTEYTEEIRSSVYSVCSVGKRIDLLGLSYSLAKNARSKTTPSEIAVQWFVDPPLLCVPVGNLSSELNRWLRFTAPTKTACCSFAGLHQLLFHAQD